MAVTIQERAGEWHDPLPTGDQAAPEAMVANSLTMFGGQLAIKVISFLFSIVVIRHLGNEQYGKYAICAAFGGLFAVLSDLGLAQFAVREIARDRSPGTIARLSSNIIALRVALALGVAGLTGIAAWIAGYDAQIRLGILIATLGLVSYAFFGMADAVAMGRERFRASAALNVSLQLVTLALSALLVFGGAGFLGLLAAATVAVLLVALVALSRLNRATPLRAPLDIRSWPSLIGSAAPFAGIMLALSVSYKADAVILSFAVPAGDVGAYSVAYNLVFTCMTVSHSINLALYPAMTREWTRSPEAAEDLFRQGLRYLLFLALPFAVFISVNAQAIVLFLYGERFARAAPALAIVAWVIPLMFVGEFLGYLAIVVDRERLAARANWISSAGNVAANLALIPVFGILAAAAVTVGTELALVGQYMGSLRRHRLLAGWWGTIGRTLVAAAALAVVAALMRWLDWPLVATAPAGICSYFLAAFAAGALGRAEVTLLAGLVSARYAGR